jgi:hypothetical protein
MVCREPDKLDWAHKMLAIRVTILCDLLSELKLSLNP